MENNITEYSVNDYRYFKADKESVEKRFPGAFIWTVSNKNVMPPPRFRFKKDGELYYEEFSFRSWFNFVKKHSSYHGSSKSLPL